MKGVWNHASKMHAGCFWDALSVRRVVVWRCCGVALLLMSTMPFASRSIHDHTLPSKRGGFKL
jgi:hypothetical protein